MSDLQSANYGPARGACPTCQRDWGSGIACQFCEQVQGLPPGIRMSSVGRRLGAYALDVLLTAITCGIGWLVWSLIVWSQGQTPGKQLLGMRVVRVDTGRPATWGTMFVRQVVGGFVGAVAGFVTLGVLYFMLLWDRNRQEVWDKVAGTIVVDDTLKRL